MAVMFCLVQDQLVNQCDHILKAPVTNFLTKVGEIFVSCWAILKKAKLIKIKLLCILIVHLLTNLGFF